MALAYCSNVKDAPKQQTELLDQLYALKMVLNTVQEYALFRER